MAERATTPPAWRLAAIVVLLGGGALGVAAAIGALAPWLVAVTGLAVTLGLIPTILAERRAGVATPEPAPPEPWPSISVLVAGRDETSVLPGLIGDLAAQDHRRADGEPRFEVIVIDDRSVDGTGPAAEAAARRHGIDAVTRVVRREGVDLPDGKGAALSAVQPADCRGDIVLVLDADARISPGYLRQVAGIFAAGADAVTARREVGRPWRGQLVGAQADEQAQDAALQLGRWRDGGMSEFRGNGMAIRRDLLAAVGGWRAAELTEDLDLSSRIAVAGVRVAIDPGLVVTEEPVRSVRGLWRQRLRWAEGAVRRAFAHGPAVLASPRLTVRARIDHAVYLAQLLAAPVIVGAIGAMLVTGRGTTAVALVATYLAAGAILAFEGLRFEARPPGQPLRLAERLGRSIRGGLFGALWLGAIPGALVRLATRPGTLRYDKTVHLGEPER